MSRKRRQRSTAIRKRIEKKQREDKKAALKAAKLAGKDDETPLTMRIDRDTAAQCAVELQALEKRLAEGPIRGWTMDDLGPEGRGLSWFGVALQEAAEQAQSDAIEMEVLRYRQSRLLDKLNALEMAASGLQLDWDVGFLALGRALSHAEEPPPPADEEE